MATEPTTAGTQLPLPVQLRDDATLDNFLPPTGAAGLMAMLREQGAKGGEPLLFLHGAPSSGKSHLLQAACHLAGEQALYLPLAELAAYPPADVLAGVSAMRLVALDDLQAVVGRRDWELALFDLYNRARESDCRLLVAADGSPRSLAFALPDLQSRLSWGVVFRLALAGDAEKQAVLQFRAARRGLAMPDEVAAYIVARAPRALPELLELLGRLDRQSLAHKRALTIPFARQVLGW